MPWHWSQESLPAPCKSVRAEAKGRADTPGGCLDGCLCHSHRPSKGWHGRGCLGLTAPPTGTMLPQTEPETHGTATAGGRWVREQNPALLPAGSLTHPPSPGCTLPAPPPSPASSSSRLPVLCHCSPDNISQEPRGPGWSGHKPQAPRGVRRAQPKTGGHLGAPQT